jgi:putative transposase
MSREGRLGMVHRENPRLSLVRQCGLLGLNRSSLYYRPAEVDEYDLELMELIDRQYMETPFYGSRRMTAWLRRQGRQVNRKRVKRLMRLMGLIAIYRPPNTSKRCLGHKVYPYLLNGMESTRPNQVWATDITYIPMAHGFIYLVAIMDWYSRYVLAWRLSNTLDSDFCVDALEEALSQGTPEVFNTDQGSQFTSEAFTGVLLQHGIRISMDGKGRCRDNVFVERLWRSLKYEEVYLKGYQRVSEARAGIGAYFGFYNRERPHQALGYRTPGEVYETGGLPAGEADDVREIVVAQPELERRSSQDIDVVSYAWPQPDPRVLAASNRAGDSLNLPQSLSEVLGPPHTPTEERNCLTWLGELLRST